MAKCVEHFFHVFVGHLYFLVELSIHLYLSWSDYLFFGFIYIYIYIYIYIIYLAVLGFKHRALCLLDRCYHLSHVPNP
jgi:hypothetical protein